MSDIPLYSWSRDQTTGETFVRITCDPKLHADVPLFGFITRHVCRMDLATYFCFEKSEHGLTLLVLDGPPYTGRDNRG